MAYFTKENDAQIESFTKDRETSEYVNSDKDISNQEVHENSMTTTIEQISLHKTEKVDYANVEESSQGVCLIAAPTAHILPADTQNTLSAHNVLNTIDSIDKEEETNKSYTQLQDESNCSLPSKFNQNDNTVDYDSKEDIPEESEMATTMKSSKRVKKQLSRKRNSKVQSKTTMSTTELTRESVALLQKQLANQDETSTSVQSDINGSATETVQRKARRGTETRMSKKEALRLLHASHKQMRKDAKNINLKELFERTILSKAGNCNGVTYSNLDSNRNNVNKVTSFQQCDTIETNTANVNEEDQLEKEQGKELLHTVSPTTTITIKGKEGDGTCSKHNKLFASPTLGSPLSLTAWSSDMISELTQSVLEDVKEQRRMRMARILPRQRNRLSPFSAPYSRNTYTNSNSCREMAGASLASAPHSPLQYSNSQSIWESQHKNYNHSQNEIPEHVKLQNGYDEEEILVIGDKDEMYEDNVHVHTNNDDQEEESAALQNSTEYENEECTVTKQEQHQYRHTLPTKYSINDDDDKDDDEDEEALLFVPSFVPVVNERSAAMLSAEKQKMWFSANCDDLGTYTGSNTQPKLVEPSSTLMSKAIATSHSQPLHTGESADMMATTENDSSQFSFDEHQPTQAECDAERATIHALKRKQEMWKLKQQLLKSQRELNKSMGANDHKPLLVNTESNITMPSSRYPTPSSSQSQSPLLSLNTSNLQQTNLSLTRSDVNSHVKYNQSHAVNDDLPTYADQLSHFTPFSPLSNSMSNMSSSSTTGEASTSMPMHETPKLKLSNETLSFIRRMNNFDNTSTQKIVIFEPASKTKTQT